MAVEKIKLKVTKVDFINWFFSDSEDVLILGKNMLSQLKVNGEANVTLEELFDTRGYTPTHIISNLDDMVGEDANEDEVDETKYEIELV